MIYRITLDLCFKKAASARAIANTAKDHFPKAITLNPHLATAKQGFILLQKCYHDEETSKPCDVIEKHYTPLP